MFDSRFLGNSRVWVFQSNRPFSQEEKEIINSKTKDFASQWKDSHGTSADGEGIIFYDQFLAFIVNGTNEALCGSVADYLGRFVKSLETEFNIDLLNRMQVAYKQDNKIKVVSMTEFQKLVAIGIVDGNTIVFNNIVTTKQEFEENWETTVKNSWHKQLLEVVA